MLNISIDYLNSNLSGATGIHSEAAGLVNEYREYYDGYVDLNNTPDGSTVVMKDVMRTVEGSIPSLVEPFLGKDIARVESQDAISKEGALEHSRLVNYQWNKKNNPLETVETMARALQIDGTVWTKVGWHIDGYPTVETVPFEAVIPDPSATSIDNMKFIIYRRKVTISDILSNPKWFGKHTLSSLQVLMPGADAQYETNNNIGRDDSYNMGQRALDEIEVFEYYGEYDVDGKGITTPVVAIWSQNTLLNAFDSPYPGFSIPFDNAVYVRRPYSIYGIGVGGIIGDKQTQRSGLMRGIFDNMNRSNNGTKFIKKGALDPTNHERLMRGSRIVEVNSKDSLANSIWDGNFNALPPDVYKMLADIETDEENLTGITKYAVGSDSRSLNPTATGVSIITSMSQKRLTFIAQHLSGLLSRVFNKWIKMNAFFSTNPILQGNYDLFVYAGTAGVEMKRGQDLTSMIQMLSTMGREIDPKIMMSLISDLARTYSLDATAQLITEAVNTPQEDPMQGVAMQMEIAAEEAKINKDASIAAKNYAIAQKSQIDTAVKMSEG